ncbi:hypothetical protein [Kitasatospora sp. NPDC092286]|uniref:hypothetical protein n=1 Tax=Kitasatospora sp. NPDC092286 TaxID=3364087 RepID=UPI0037FC3C93
MNVSVASLVELLNVPGSGAGYEVPWNGSLVEVGLEFPADYQDFINMFGRGAIGGELWVHSPLTAGPVGWASGGFARMVARTILEVGPMFNGLRASYPDLFPYPMFPDPGGLLEWGCNYNGDRCFWLTGDPDPDRWPVVVWFRGAPAARAWSKADGGMAEFLVQVLSDPTSDLLASAEDRTVWVPDAG